MGRQETEAASVSLRVLGPLEADGGPGAPALAGPRQRAVLARLIVAGGRVVGTDRLVADLWPEQVPEGAVAAIRTFVADLRRVLEPDRAPRSPARLLVTASPGYALRTGPGAVDADRFEEAAAAGADLLAAGRARPALERLDEALGLWRGPAYAEFAEYPWARGEADRLEELRLLALERRAEAAMALGRAGEAAAEMEPHTRAHPLRENAWHHLALALYRSGRQGDALAALRRARGVLAEELGIDPGERLRALEGDILAHAPRLDPAAGSREARPAAEAPAPLPAAAAGRPFVGRAAEFDALEQAAAAAAGGEHIVAALVAGGAGAGKTALAETLARHLAQCGWNTAWGDSPEHDGAPPVWPWERIAAALTARSVPPPEPPAAAPADPAAARFRAQRQAVDLVGAAAERAPVLLVVDDLHRAGEETLDLLTALAAEPLDRPVLLVGTYRSDAITPALSAALARLARSEPVRVYLEGLSEQATGELVRSVAGSDVDAATVRAIHRRSGGNPFYARELARLYAEDGAAALEAVPAGVGDVIRHRLTGLDAAAVRLLRRAAVIGRDIDPDVLAAVAGDAGDGRGDDILDAVEAALEAGFLTEAPSGRLRFAHVLVRDAVYEAVSGPRRARWHAAAARAIERLRPGDAASLAHHFARAGDHSCAAGYGRAAARRAEERFAPHEAAGLWREALAAHDRAGTGAHRDRLEAVMGLGRALAVTGRLDEARTRRAEAVAGAERLGDAELSARTVTDFDVPALWPRNDDEGLARRIAAAAERALEALPPHREEQRARLHAALALELRGEPGRRGPRAAREAERAARRLGDPALLATALNACFMQSFQRAGGARRRAAIGAELVEVAAGHGLVAFEVLGRLILVQAHSALADFAAADRHAAAADRLGERYEVAHVGVFTRFYSVLRTAVGGGFEEAEAAYRAAAARLRGTQMPGLEEGLMPLALVCLRLESGRPPVPDGGGEWGPYGPWVRPLAHPGGGAEAVAVPPPAPLGLLDEALTGLGARAAIAAGDQAAMRAAYRRLLPAADELAGAGSGVLTLGPVAQRLGDLAVALGTREDAAGHYRRAAAVAERAGAPRWAAAAEEALNRAE